MGDASAGASGATVRVDAERVAIDGALDFTTARDVLGRVRDAIGSTPALTVDLAGVTRANSAGLALVVEWLAEARRTGHAVTFANVPDGLRQLARVCQVDALVDAASA